MKTSVATAETVTPTAPAAGSKRERLQPQPQPPQHQHHVRQLNSAGCGGEGCVTRDPWPVHHVRHRGNLCRLCTSCVLRYHPGSFCPKCFDLIDAAGGGRPSPRQPAAIVHCASCPSVCHTGCLSDAEKAAAYVCPSCANPNAYSYFRVDDGDGDGDVSGSPNKRGRVSGGSNGEENLQMDAQRQRTIDRESAKVLLAAARLASASMNRAVAFARSEAERKAKDAVIARKKAKEMLEKALIAAKRERSKRQDALVPVLAVREPQRKKSMKLDNAVASMAAQKRRLNSGKDHWGKLEDVVPLAQKSPVREIPEDEKVKVPFPSSYLNHSHAPNPSLQDNVKLDIMGKNGSLPTSKSNFAVEIKKGAPKVPLDSGVGVRVPPKKHDASVTMTNPRVIFSGMPDKASLHS